VASGVAGGGVWLTVKRTAAIKCERCWQHTTDVGSQPEHPTLCARCVTNLSLPGENRRMV
jgi:isoleucyl-tRNA synthetase